MLTLFNLTAAFSEDIRLFGHSLIQISDEEKEDIVDDCIENKEEINIGKGSFGTVYKCKWYILSNKLSEAKLRLLCKVVWILDGSRFKKKLNILTYTIL